MKAKKYLLDNLAPIIKKLNQDDKQEFIKNELWETVAGIMEEYAFKAWMAGENNGRTRLKPTGELDKEGSRYDFKEWTKNKPKKLKFYGL